MTCTCNVNIIHEEWCEEAPITKGAVIEMLRNGSGFIIDDYLLLIEAGITPDQTKECAVGEAVDSAECFLGLHGGACKH